MLYYAALASLSSSTLQTKHFVDTQSVVLLFYKRYIGTQNIIITISTRWEWITLNGRMSAVTNNSKT